MNNDPNKKLILTGPFMKFIEPSALSDLGYLEPVANAFRSNIMNACSVALIPETMANTAAASQYFRNLLSAENIRQLKTSKPGEGLNEEQEAAALEIAQKRMREAILDEAVVKRLSDNAEAELAAHLNSPEFQTSAEELLRQVLVLCWNSLEILVSDVLQSVLNTKPSLVLRLTSSRDVKDFFTPQSLTDALEENGFDLSGCVGDVFVDRVRFDNLPRIKGVLCALLADEDVNASLKASSVFQLFQQRNLIVHKRGMVDRKYASKVSDQPTVGSLFTPEAPYIKECIGLVSSVGSGILLAANATLVE